MNKYNKYKPSGIEWLGDIPEHWEVKRIKDLVKSPLKYGANEPAIDDNRNDPRYIRITDFSDNGNLKKETFKSLTYEIAKSYLLKSGDILFARSGATVGKSFQFKNYQGLACYAGYLIKASPNKKLLLSDFLYYFTKSTSYDEWKKSIFIQATIQNISAEKYNQLEISVPSLDQQTSIAAYLDHKIAAIDKKTALLEKKIEYYKELRKSLINQTVTKGLNPNVKLKNSGIEWIGEIPEHWEVKRFKDNLNLYTGNSISDKSIYEVKGKTFDYIATKNIEVETGEINYDNGIYIPKKNISFKISKANSVLLCLEGGSAGKKVAFNTKDICFVNKLCSIKAKRNNNKFIYYYIKSLLFENQFFAVLNGLIGGVSISLIKHFFIVFPPIEEQTAIATYLDKKTTKIDQIISNIQSQIAQLKELRKVLINDVVTGKIKVWEE